MRILDGTRMIKTKSSQKNGTYELINNRIGKSLILNYNGARILRKIHQGKKINEKYKDFILNLSSLGIIVEDDEISHNVFLCDDKKLKMPLTCLNIELTNKCNLKCIHCGDTVKALRKEKNHNTKDCKNCKSIKNCKNTDCRIIAYKYHKEENKSNPVTCFITKKEMCK